MQKHIIVVSSVLYSYTMRRWTIATRTPITCVTKGLITNYPCSNDRQMHSASGSMIWALGQILMNYIQVKQGSCKDLPALVTLTAYWYWYFLRDFLSPLSHLSCRIRLWWVFCTTMSVNQYRYISLFKIWISLFKESAPGSLYLLFIHHGTPLYSYFTLVST